MSDNKVLFEVTEASLETGMRGYPVGYCPTSAVDPQKGLFYCGKPVSELAHFKPRQVLYLLYKGKEGSEKEVEKFYAELSAHSTCPSEVIELIEQLPRTLHPMKLFSMALLALPGSGDYRTDCLDLIGKLPHLVATVINHHAGWGKTPDPKPELGYMENFTRMVLAPDANRSELERVFELFNVLHYDHGGGNLSAFTGKAVASGLEDLYGSLAAAMCALAGPRHGRANQDCLEFVKKVLEKVGPDATEPQVEQLLRDRLASKKLIYGFGHAVLRVEDPRATLQYALAGELYPDHPLVKIALLLREAGPRILAENPKIANPYPNVDAISGTLLSAAGFPYPDYFTLLFGLSRCVGIGIQIVYERTVARDGKGTPIVRPKYFYRKQ